MEIKNYRKLCEILDVQYFNGGNAQRRQLQWFQEYFTYDKKGYKFIITGVLNKPVKPMEDKRGGAYNTYDYIKNIERLILDILVQTSNKGKIFLSKNKFFHALEMVNINYLDCNQRVPKLSKYLDIDEGSVQEWFDTTGGVLERSLESALTSLRNQALIIWSKEITICKAEEIEGSEHLVEIKHKDKYGEESYEYITQIKTRRIIREATDEEKKFIIRTERDTMDTLECLNKQEVIKKSLWKEFDSKVNEILKEKYNIIYYYQSYKILSNPEHIQAKWLRVNHLLNEDIRKEEKIIVNSSVLDRLKTNATSRYTNAIKELEKNEIIMYQEEKISRRSSDEYIDDNIKLNNALINRNADDIRKDVRKVKLE